MIGCWLTGHWVSPRRVSCAVNDAWGELPSPGASPSPKISCWMRKLQTAEISKTYRGRKVVDNVSLWVEQGEVVGLLGPNGAGKTTSFYMIVGLIRPDSGSVLVSNSEGTEDITSIPM